MEFSVLPERQWREYDNRRHPDDGARNRMDSAFGIGSEPSVFHALLPADGLFDISWAGIRSFCRPRCHGNDAVWECGEQDRRAQGLSIPIKPLSGKGDTFHKKKHYHRKAVMPIECRGAIRSCRFWRVRHAPENFWNITLGVQRGSSPGKEENPVSRLFCHENPYFPLLAEGIIVRGKCGPSRDSPLRPGGHQRMVLR